MNLSKEFKLWQQSARREEIPDDLEFINEMQFEFVGPKADHWQTRILEAQPNLGGCGGTHLYGIRLSERKRAFAQKHGIEKITIHESFFPYRCIEDFMQKGRDGN